MTMENCETRVRIITKAIRLFSLAATCLLTHGAWAAVWTGGASGDFNNVANWDGDITTSTLVFTNDTTVTLSADAVVKQPLTDGNSTDVPTEPIKNNYTGKNVTFNLNEHTLTANYAGDQYWHVRDSSVTFMGGGTAEFVSGSTTNSVFADNNNHYGMTLTVSGAGTKFVGSYDNRVRVPASPGTRFKVLNGAEAIGPHFYFGGCNSTNEISSGASLTFGSADGFVFGSYPSSGHPGYNNLLTIDGATLASRNPSSAGTLYIGKTGAAWDNLLLAKNGAKIDVYALSIGNTAATNNEMRVTGSGTKFTQVATSSATSYIGNGASSVSNRLVVADHAVAEFNRVMLVGTGASIGATLRIENGGVVTNKSAVYIGHNNGAKNGKSARVAVTGEGSEWDTKDKWAYLINGTGNAEDAHEIFVSDGAKFNGKLAMAGVGNRLVVSNATASLSNLMTTNTTEGVTGASGSTIRIAGANAKLTTTNLNGGDKGFAGSEVIEFVIPETVWAEAPFQANVAFTIREGVTLKLDAASVKAFQKANPSGGIVPLMTTGSSSRRITISEAAMEALSANLPNGCSLVNESGVLSVRMPKAPGLAIFVR